MEGRTGPEVGPTGRSGRALRAGAGPATRGIVRRRSRRTPAVSGPSPTRRRRGDRGAAPTSEAATEKQKSAGLRIVHGKAQPKRTAKRRTVAHPAAPPRRRSRKTGGSPDIKAEIVRLGGRKGARLYEQVVDAADAFAHDRNRVAVRILEPVRDAVPEAPSVRELLGLALYRLGNYRAAAKELDKFVVAHRVG